MDFWTSNTEGKDLRRITDSMIGIGQAPFTPDGSQIGFNGTNQQLVNSAYVVSAQGGNIRQLRTEGYIFTRFMFSVNSKWIYFDPVKTGKNQIWKIKSDLCGEPIQLTKDGGINPRPTSDG